MKSEILEKNILYSRRFLQISELVFKDEKNNIRAWESADRVNSSGAVMIIATIKNGKRIEDDELILVKQFRPPSGRYMLEFPAGLIDDNEKPQESAIRELYEETGFEGEVTKVFNPAWSSPGLSGETIVIVTMNVDGSKYLTGNPQSHQEESENIETFRVKRSELLAFVSKEEQKGVGIDTKIYAILIGLGYENN